MACTAGSCALDSVRGVLSAGHPLCDLLWEQGSLLPQGGSLESASSGVSTTHRHSHPSRQLGPCHEEAQVSGSDSLTS